VLYHQIEEYNITPYIFPSLFKTDQSFALVWNKFNTPGFSSSPFNQKCVYYNSLLIW